MRSKMISPTEHLIPRVTLSKVDGHLYPDVRDSAGDFSSTFIALAHPPRYQGDYSLLLCLHKCLYIVISPKM